MLGRAALVWTAFVVLTAATTANAIPPWICHLRLEGRFVDAERQLGMPVAVRLQMRSDYGDISFHGHLRCTANIQRERRCFLPATTIAGSLEVHTGTMGYDLQFAYLLDNDRQRVCELTGFTSFLRGLCPGSIGGTFTCPGMSGTYGLAVDSCEPCVSDFEP